MRVYNNLFKHSLLFTGYVIFYSQYNFISVWALIGQYVREAQPNEFPYIISLMRISPTRPQHVNNHVCTGTLITRQDVLLADHCVTNYHPLRIEIVYGSIDLFNGTKISPLWWLTYNQWAQRNYIVPQFTSNDIAIVKLLGNVPLAINIAKVSLKPYQKLFRSELRIVGWGKRDDGRIPRILHAGEVILMKNSECKALLLRLTGDRHPIHERRLCTSANPYILIDSGDSGGPLLKNNTIIAINRGVIPNVDGISCQDQVNFHFSVHYYQDFILDIKNNFNIMF